MKTLNILDNDRDLTFLFVFGMYRSGTTILARTLAGEKNIAFASDPIRPFFNFYRTSLQKKITNYNFEDNNRPLNDYFNSDKKYIELLIKSNFSDLITQKEVSEIRTQIVKHSSSYSPKFSDSLMKSAKENSSNYQEEIKFYLDLILSLYGDEKTSLLGIKEVWSIEMAFPIMNWLKKKAKIIVVLRDPLDMAASSINGSGNYSILSLARQWRKQVVFYNCLKQTFPDSVELLTYESFCTEPVENLRDIFKKINIHKEIFFSSGLDPVDDYGKSWKKNSSFPGQNNSQSIDKKSIGKYKKSLNAAEIEWLIYLTHMVSYKKYNHFDALPEKPKSAFPRRDINKIAKWAKPDIDHLEGINLSSHLVSEHERLNKINYNKDQRFTNIDLIMEQI